MQLLQASGARVSRVYDVASQSTLTEVAQTLDELIAQGPVRMRHKTTPGSITPPRRRAPIDPAAAERQLDARAAGALCGGSA
eukprot:6584641-Prymnesium_polylepis.1